MRLGRDPMFCCCIMYPTDRELAAGTSDIHLGPFTEDSFQGFPLRAARVVRRHRPAARIARDLSDCGFNAALLVGFCGSNFTPDDIRSARFVELTRELKKRKLAVGVCIPFADTVDNRLTREDPRIHQLTHDGKRPCVRFDPGLADPPYPIYIIDYGCDRFVAFAREIIRAAADVGMDFIDYAEPDYWPTEDNGYGAFLREAWQKQNGTGIPHPSTLPHRGFMEQYHLQAMKRMSAFAHRHGLLDHMTASPLGHLPYLVCQNYGLYSSTAITELSSTYHYSYGLGWRDRLKRTHGIDCPLHGVSSIGCLETRAMRGWAERHATYLVAGQSLPSQTFANALDQQMFLYNMDVIYWEYPSIRWNYYETSDPWITADTAWPELRRTFRQKADAYRALPSAFHAATPAPEVLVFFSKRGVYADREQDRATPCAYASVLRLLSGNAGAILPWFLYAENMGPLEDNAYDPGALIIDEHHPVPPGAWSRLQRWLSRGSRILVYGGGPGRDWDTGEEMLDFPASFERLFGIRRRTEGAAAMKARAKKPALDLPLPAGTRGREMTIGRGVDVLASAGGRPLVTARRIAGTSRAVYVGMPLCELPGSCLPLLVGHLLDLAGCRKVEIEGPLDIEPCLYRGAGRSYLAVKNHSSEKRSIRIRVATGWKPRRVTELMGSGRIADVGFDGGRAFFTDAPEANSIRIYELLR